MKALRFIAIFSFLLIFNFADASIIYSQDEKDVKPTEKSSDKTTVKPAGKIEAIPVKQPQERYRIGMYDVLDVTVYKHANLSQSNVRMDDYGRIRLPRVAAPLVAICKTENELAEEITKIYKDSYLVDPYVTVVVREQNSQPMAVMGAVNNPGRFFTNRRGITLLELLSYAGGPNVEFAGNTVQVARIGGISGCADKEAVKSSEDGILFFTYKLPDIQKGKTNPVLKPGDIVSVLDADTVYVYGNVNKEGPVKLKEPITLLQAIVFAEGLKPSSKSKVRVLRQKGDSLDREELTFDLKDIKERKVQDPFLQPNDIIAVSEDPLKSIFRNVAKAVSNGLPSLFYRIP